MLYACQPRRPRVTLDRKQRVRLRLPVPADRRHALLADDLASQPGSHMGLQRARQHVDRGRGQELIVGEDVFPNVALGSAKLIRRLSTDWSGNRRELRPENCRFDQVEPIFPTTMNHGPQAPSRMSKAKCMFSEIMAPRGRAPPTQETFPLPPTSLICIVFFVHHCGEHAPAPLRSGRAAKARPWRRSFSTTRPFLRHQADTTRSWPAGIR